MAEKIKKITGMRLFMPIVCLLIACKCDSNTGFL